MIVFHLLSDTDDCADNPCVNGECTDEVNGFYCTCSDGYLGTICDMGK